MISSSDEEVVDLLLAKNKRIVGSLLQFYMLGTKKERVPPLRVCMRSIMDIYEHIALILAGSV